MPEAPGLRPELRATAEALELLGQLGVRRAPSVEAAVGWLAGAQVRDGSWGEVEAAPAQRMALTGRIGGLLARSVYVRPAVLAAAGDWLARSFDPTLVEGADGPAVARLAGVAAYFANASHEASDAILQWCGRALEKGFRAGYLGGLGAARVLDACDAVALPGAHLDPAEVVRALLGEQQPDGGWPGAPLPAGFDPAATPDSAAPSGSAAASDPAARVGATLEALRALARLPR